MLLNYVRPDMNDIPISEMNFEQAMSELERIVTQLERGDVPVSYTHLTLPTNREV